MGVVYLSMKPKGRVVDVELGLGLGMGWPPWGLGGKSGVLVVWE